MHKIIDVKPLKEFQIRVKFNDGKEGNIDLSDLIGKGVFAPLKDPKQFNKVAVDSQTHTVCWPNGIDLCPDSIYEELILKQSSN